MPCNSFPLRLLATVSFHYSRIALLLLFWQCYAQPFPNPPACNNANPWATNLVNADGQDPCQVHQQLKGLGFSISCCFDDQDIATVGQSKCGPCNQQSYNLLGACIACVFGKSQKNSDLKKLQPPPPFSPNHFPAISEWNKGDRNDPLPAQLVLPPWINIPPNNNIFDLQSAIAIGSKSLASSPPAAAGPTLGPPVLPASAAPPVISPQAVTPSGQATSNDSHSPVSPSTILTKSPTSLTTPSTSTLPKTNGSMNTVIDSLPSNSLGSSAISSTVVTEMQPFHNGKSSSGPTPSSSMSGGTSSGASKHSNAGAIAGAVIGALFALGLVFGAFYIIHRRRRARTPHSAHFLTVAGPGMTYRPPISIGDIDSPPPFTQGAWKDLPPEKVEARYY